MNSDCCLLIFVRNPELGKVKTRLAADVGQEAALEIYLKLNSMIREVASNVKVDKIVYYSSFVDKDDSWSNDKYQKKLQRGNNLGERMDNAITEVCQAGYSRVCLMGSDVFGITEEVLYAAFERLNDHDVVVGPAQDGGYYLIGVTKPNAGLFNLKYWSTPDVFTETIRRIEQQKLSYSKTKLLRDIDEINDLKGTGLYQTD